MLKQLADGGGKLKENPEEMSEETIIAGSATQVHATVQLNS